MSMNSFDELDNEIDEFSEATTPIPIEASPSTKLERRRKIEDLFEEKLNTLEKLYLCLKYETPAIHMDEQLRLAAKKPIDRMLEISARYGL